MRRGAVQLQRPKSMAKKAGPPRSKIDADLCAAVFVAPQAAADGEPGTHRGYGAVTAYRSRAGHHAEAAHRFRTGVCAAGVARQSRAGVRAAGAARRSRAGVLSAGVVHQSPGSPVSVPHQTPIGPHGVVQHRCRMLVPALGPHTSPAQRPRTGAMASIMQAQTPLDLKVD